MRLTDNWQLNEDDEEDNDDDAADADADADADDAADADDDDDDDDDDNDDDDDDADDEEDLQEHPAHSPLQRFHRGWLRKQPQVNLSFLILDPWSLILNP